MISAIRICIFFPRKPLLTPISFGMCYQKNLKPLNFVTVPIFALPQKVAHLQVSSSIASFHLLLVSDSVCWKPQEQPTTRPLCKNPGLWNFGPNSFHSRFPRLPPSPPRPTLCVHLTLPMGTEYES